jgi:F-type H+-transporting ATPase subunit b
MHFDEAMWVALGFAMFVILVWKKAGAALAESLDARSAKIKSELDEARKLHEEAKAELDSLKGLKSEAEKEAKIIVENAKTAAKRIREIAAQKAEENVARREVQAAAKILASEAALVNELRAKAAGLAVDAARELISERMDEETSLKLVEASVEQINAVK